MARSIDSHKEDCPCPACLKRRGLSSRPPVFGIRLPDDVREWLRSRPEGAARWVTDAVRKEIGTQEG